MKNLINDPKNGRRIVKVRLRHLVRNGNETHPDDPLGKSVPRMLAPSSFARVTGSAGTLKQSAAAPPSIPARDRIHADPGFIAKNIIPQRKLHANNLKVLPGEAPTEWYEWGRKFNDWKARGYRKERPMLLGDYLKARTSTRTLDSAEYGDRLFDGAGVYTRRFLTSNGTPERMLRNGGAAALAAYAGSRLLKSKHPIRNTLIAGGLAAGAAALFRKTASAEERIASLEELANPPKLAGIMTDDKQGVIRLVMADASLAERDRLALASALNGMPDSTLRALLRRLGPGLAGAGIGAALFALLFGHKSGIAGAALGYMAGNLTGMSRRGGADYDIYGRVI